MAVALLNKNHITHCCKFSYDTWDEDKDKLPNLIKAGKGVLSTIQLCSQGSLAIGTNGINYILTGNNEWIKYSQANSSESSGEILEDNIIPITNEDILSDRKSVV